MKYLLCVLPLLAGCATGSFSLGSAESPTTAGGAPVPSEGIRLVWDGDEGPGILDLLNEYVRVTGLTVLYTADTGTQIQRRRLYMVADEKVLDVAAEEVVAVVESLLAMNHFALAPMHEAEPRLVRIVSLETQERNQVKRSSRYVPVDEIEAYRTRAATLITTSICLPNTDVRTLSNSMRTMLTDANTQQIIPVGNSNTMVLTGFGPGLCDLVELLRRVDEASAVEDEGQPR